ncbi:hypothetical protein B4O97_03465 [Marispirochaeta aestuarii]|uniref:Phage tail tape measure protein n=1 Tax=Marispirochaeta aestuarii TaxID=1963862 RepID=A0A1Y1S1A8_9SPIO|nr:hypothetical protein [Marispirochaeta aestuarii]ORC37261.1 hypothetical protein B4O97_03465 [Marispirochaeta aestuarii]
MPKPTVSTTFNAVDRLSGPIRRMQQNVKRFALAAGAGMAAATFAVARSTMKFAEAGDEIAKTSRRLGLSAESFQELRFAADRSGVSAESFTTAMERLNKNVGDLRAGTGTLTTLLNKQNPALAKQLKLAESNEQAFSILVEQMAAIENPMDRAALAQAAFGRAGQELIVMAENGTAGIEALREEARKYGNVISTNAAKSSERFIDSMTNLKNSMTAVKNNAIAPLVNAMQPFIQRMADFVALNQDLINQRIQETITRIANAGRWLAQNWRSGVIPAVLAGAGAFKLVTSAIVGTRGLIEAIKAVKKAMAAGRLLSLTTPWGLLAAAIGGAAVLIIKYWEPIKAFFQALWGGVLQSFEDAKRRILAIVDAIMTPVRAVGDFIGGLGADSTPESREYFGNRGGSRPEMRGLLSANQGMAESRSYSESKSTVDVNIGGLPNGSTVRQRGIAPGVNLNYGYLGGR